MMRLAALIERFEPALHARYGEQLTGDMRRALFALRRCRDEDAPHWLSGCPGCAAICALPQSCGHRACPHCQHDSGAQWLQRQQQRRLPVDYFLVTFTLPAQLRGVARCHPRRVYAALLRCAWECLARFGRNDPKLAVDLGATAVLHTHSRRRDYHPHVHLVVPGGGVNLRTGLWRQKGKYLFNAGNLATVFRAKLLDALRAEGLTLPAQVPTQWVVDCRAVGSGEAALGYLARYLYRGVLSEADILDCVEGQVRFRYRDGQTGETRTRRLDGADFLWLLLQHVLPKGFHRARDFGLLHHKRKALLQRLQLLLRMAIRPLQATPKRPLRCPHCGTPMRTIATRLPAAAARARVRPAQADRSPIM